MLATIKQTAPDTIQYTVSVTAFIGMAFDYLSENTEAVTLIVVVLTFIFAQIWRAREDRRRNTEIEMMQRDLQLREINLAARVKTSEGETLTIAAKPTVETEQDHRERIKQLHAHLVKTGAIKR